MNVKACLDLLMGRLGGRTAPDLRAKCLQEMVTFQETEMEGAEDLPWFLITEEAETDTVPNERRILLPSDFIREVEEEDLLLIDDSGEEIKLGKVGYEEAEQRFGGSDPGTPQVYTIRGNYILLHPTPDRIMTVRFPDYYARQEQPVDSEESENGWFKWASDLMMSGPGLVVATLHLKDPELVTTMAALVTRANTRLRNATVAREEANRNRRMG